MSKIRLSIVIPVYNNYNFTKACLEDLLHLPDDHEVVIVDNGSTDETRFLKSSDRVKILRNKENLGFSKSCNIGYTMTSGSSVMFLNNDIRVRDNKEGWTLPILEEAEKGNCLVGPTVGVLDYNFNFVTEANKMSSNGYVYMSGWNLTATIDTWNELILDEYDGPFTQEFTTYFEDTDLSLRAQEKKYQMKIVNCPVHHFGKMTSKKLGVLKLYQPAKEKFIAKWRDRAQPLLRS